MKVKKSLLNRFLANFAGFCAKNAILKSQCLCIFVKKACSEGLDYECVFWKNRAKK